MHCIIGFIREKVLHEMITSGIMVYPFKCLNVGKKKVRSSQL